MRSLLLPLSFAGLLGLALVSKLPVSSQQSAPAAGHAPVSPTAHVPEFGTFPDEWIAGNDCANDPPVQVHPYNESFYILRQSKCLDFEGPFLYLIFGDQYALLLDTGSESTAPIEPTVTAIVDAYKLEHDLPNLQLIVAHTHGHGDHVQGDAQFQQAGYPVINTTLHAVEGFWGFADYPNDTVTFDLGNRVIDVFGTPGHHPVSITVYDRRTQLLLSGDIVYPGHLFIFGPNDWPVFVSSIQRMVDWVDTHPTQWVLGCHIEWCDGLGCPLTYPSSAHPSEHELQLKPALLSDLLATSLSMGANPVCTIMDHFEIQLVYLCGFNGLGKGRPSWSVPGGTFQK